MLVAQATKAIFCTRVVFWINLLSRTDVDGQLDQTRNALLRL